MKKYLILITLFGLLTLFILSKQYDNKIEAQGMASYVAYTEKMDEEVKKKQEAVNELGLKSKITQPDILDISRTDFSIWDELNKGNEYKIVFLGDSTTEQNFQTNGLPGHVKLIQTELSSIYGAKIKVINSGKSGEGIKDMASRLDTSVIQHYPDLVIINSSLNDINKGIDNGSFKKELNQVIEIIKKETSADILIRTSNVTQYEDANLRLVEQLNPIMKDLAENNEVGFVDVFNYYSLMAEKDGIEKYNNDPTHPNENGQKLIADIILYSLIQSKD